jgi:hypothetical protein
MNIGHWLMFNGYVKPQYEALAEMALDAFYVKPELISQAMLDMFQGMQNWSETIRNTDDAAYCAKKLAIWKKIQIDENYESHGILVVLPPVLERAADPDEGRPNVWTREEVLVRGRLPNVFEEEVVDWLPAPEPEAEAELVRVEINLDQPPPVVDIDLEESHAEEAKRQQIPEPQYTKKEEQKADIDYDDPPTPMEDDDVTIVDPPAPAIPVEKPIWSYVVSAGVLIGLAWLLLQDTDREY